ncbi:hypothetical protein NKI54_19810 [Mesorhizobium sp. M0663]|uniref:hypothetical protein n=1 Tax=unclassified Mesorhizobium TaxID=325217 RepID=UPI003336AAA7
MSLEEIFDFIRKVTPELLQGWVSSWATLFKNTYIMRSDANDQVISTALAISTLFAIFFVLITVSTTAARLKAIAIGFAAAVVVLFCFCNAIRIWLNFPLTRETIGKLQPTWDYVTMAFTLAMVMMMLFAILSFIKAVYGNLRSTS